MRKKIVSRVPSATWDRVSGGASYSTDIRVTPRGRLKMRLLVFETPAKLRSYWGKLRGGKFGGLCQGTRGAVNSLGREVLEYGKNGKLVGQWIEVDGRYFAVMGLVRGYLGMEVVTHESVHAGIAYYDRSKGRLQWSRDDALPEEDLAYPIGIIAKKVVIALEKGGFYDKC